MVSLPGFQKYSPNFEFVLKSNYRDGVRIATEIRERGTDLIKISPHLSGLKPAYIRGPVRNVPGYLSKLERLDKIERNFNLD